MNSGTRWLWHITYCLYIISCYSDSQAQPQPPPGIRIAYQWSQLEFDYESEEERQNAIDSGEFNAGYLLPIDVDVYYSKSNADNNKVLLSIPRPGEGVSATYGSITNRTYNGNPIIAPYPSWSWHKNIEQCNEDRIVSVFRAKIDECGRLWILDRGVYLNKQICPAQILAFDLETDELIHRYEIPDNQLQSNSGLVTLIVDILDPPPTGLCKNTFVYAADCKAPAIIVHDIDQGSSWKIVDKTMYPDPAFGTYNIAGQQFEVMDGILGMDLSPYKAGEDRVLFFHAMSSGTENWVNTSYLRNQSLFENNPSSSPHIFHTYSGRRRTQAPAEAIDKDGIAYFGLVSNLSINCWNTATEYGEQNIGVIAQNDTTLQFASGVKVITNPEDSQDLWFITVRFQKIATGTLNPNETNFRIQTGRISDLLAGSRCRQ